MKIKFLLLLLISNNIIANVSITNDPIPGGVAVIDFYDKKKNIIANYYQLPIYIQQIKSNNYQALIGIPLTAKTGKHHININNKKLNFNVVNNNYASQYITLTNKKKKYVDIAKEDLLRISAERKTLAKAKQTFSRYIPIKKFILPANGVISSKFGLRRFFNDKARLPHSGIDIAAKLNTKIVAANDGKIILIGNFYFNGKTIIIDHGMGLLSIYIHLNKILVKKNKLVKQGDTIALMGKTGRTTGVNLHFGIYLNQVAVNPTLFINDND